MGSFANTVFSTMLAWLQGLVSVIWSALTTEGGNSFLQFIGSNWLKISAVLCAIGLIADFTVYIFRWEPYKVWLSFWRRLRKSKNGTESSEAQTEAEEPEGIFFPSPKEEQKPDAVLTACQEEDDLGRWREQEPAQEKTEPPVEITKAGYIVPEDSPYRRPEARPRRRRIRVSLLGENGDDEEYHYIAPPPLVDKKEAYNPPVYPEKWTGSREQDS